MIVGLPYRQALRIKQARDQAEFTSFDDFTRRTGVASTLVTRLARADAFGSLQIDRRTSLWQSLRPAWTAPLFRDMKDPEPLSVLLAMAEQREVFADYRTTGLSLKAHLISFFRTQLNELRIVRAIKLGSLEDGRFVRVGGLVLVRQRRARRRESLS